jgi:uncharacterized protein YecE (DUF72 family)
LTFNLKLFPVKSQPPANLRLGTSSWSSEDWVGVFYPPGTPPADFLGHYAKVFDTVEVDSTFYRSPSASMVKNWRERTPPGFTFAAKVPRTITHDKVLEDCEQDLKQFLKAMDLLGDKLGPLLLQFPYFNRQAFPRPEDFLKRLKAFLYRLPDGYSFAVELRNKAWINASLLDLLRGRKVALALIDHPWMTPARQLVEKLDVLTADFAYLRWLGDRKGIEEKTKTWDRLIVRREKEIESWVPVVEKLLGRARVFGYFNNHYGGYAPGSVALFYEIWEKMKESGGGR